MLGAVPPDQTRTASVHVQTHAVPATSRKPLIARAQTRRRHVSCKEGQLSDVSAASGHLRSHPSSKDDHRDAIANSMVRFGEGEGPLESAGNAKPSAVGESSAESSTRSVSVGLVDGLGRGRSPFECLLGDCFTWKAT